MADEASRHRGRFAGSRAIPWLAASVALALLIGALLLFLPLGMSASCSSTSVGQGTGSALTDAECSQTQYSLLEQEGWPLAGIVLIPAALCAAPFLAPRRAQRPAILGAIALLSVAVFLGAASIGLFFLPVVVTLGIAAARH